ncbi:MAG: class I SAM-dependent methyltransferase [Actinomycetota bacterium]|jgi:ubiquinone/menaquinone biosynthesis C-methylase UbiE|nr:class I SAM-dependent methyltransferase [Actinomycetota bacterium]
MARGKSDFHFKMMCIRFKLRDFFSPPLTMLKEAGIKRGYKILDFGCGFGSHSIAASKIIGVNGKVYSLDINPLAINEIRNTIKKRKLKNIDTIQSDCKTSLPDNCIDVILIYDVFHHIDNKSCVLEEFYRVLKKDCILSFSDHHMNKEDILSELTGKGLFKLKKENNKTFSFIKI